MSTAAWSPVALAVVSAGVGRPGPTRLLADRVAEAVCRALAAGGARADVEVVELHRLAVDLAHHTTHGRVGLDLREAIAAVVAADGLVVATPVVAASPSEVFDAFFAVLGDGVLSGMPVLLALSSSSWRRPPGLVRVVRGRLTDVHTRPVPTTVFAGPADPSVPTDPAGPADPSVPTDPSDRQPTAPGDGDESGDGDGLHARIDRAASELAAAMRAHRR
ncbi:NAD(P)H-dependent oxidoreductase [Streptomyces galbus]|uniref:NAD(P)H-dependent oxidoreductase n=1 Tax=Streptomyces galbus TaxID=33898 RepID=UPI00144AA55F|nr:NAD(P)H-dependent oxidoreductase [Streptomyces galbus]GHD49901.1 oxidoreductase [Streptomyces galbus]